MPTIELLAERVAPVSPTASIAEVFNWFTNQPDSLALPVVEDDRPVGLIDRCDFLRKLAEPLGHSRYGSRPVAFIMDADPAVVEFSVRIGAFSDVILKNTDSALMRGFIVTRRGKYFGVGTAISLLRHVNVEQTRKLGEQEQQLRNLRNENQNERVIASAQNAFVNVVQRELDAPLRTIGTFADLLERQHLSPVAIGHIAAIQRASEECLTVLQSAYDLTGSEAGNLVLDNQPVLLRSLMDSIAKDWSNRGNPSQVSIMVSYEGDTELAALLDESRFRATYDTLINCALRLVRDGIIEVGLKAQVIGDKIDLQARVRDDGPGLDEDQLDNPFDDMGLEGNLAISSARRLMDHLGGRIWATNNNGRGATYGFDTLVGRGFIKDENEDENVSHLERLYLNGRPHVLIADDNATNRIVAQALCEMFGCTCETVEDGQAAVRAASGGSFDLILMDIKMPLMDGVAATRAIRALPSSASATPIIALTANADPDDALSYVASGMLCVVEKPIKPERLRMAMNMALSSAEKTGSESDAAKASGERSTCVIATDTRAAS